MQVTFENGMFKCHCTFDERSIPKAAGFYWDIDLKRWITKSVGIATKLNPYFDEAAKSQISKDSNQIIPWTKNLNVPHGLALLPFQEKATRFSLERSKSYLALDPGLGKTPIAAVIASTLNAQSPIVGLYICPPFLTRNTEAEFSKWAPELNALRYNPKVSNSRFTILPDSILTRKSTMEDINTLLCIAKTGRKTTILFVDEAHRFKNDEAARTKALFGHVFTSGIATLFSRIVYLSGTPMPNRPIELYPVLAHSAPETIQHMTKFQYALKYCGAIQNQWGWDYSGASNLKELAGSIHDKFMLRYKKQEVLTDLPEKSHEVVVLSDQMPPKLGRMSRNILNQISAEDLMHGKLAHLLDREELPLSTYRRELGLAKMASSLEFILNELDNTDESFLIFAIHKDVIKSLEFGLLSFKPFIITGDTPMSARHEMVAEYQASIDRRVFIGNIQAAGVGLTLTKATRVVFCEFSWTPGENEQASDRCHRIGQKNNVLVQYLVFDSSIDKAVIETELSKRRITEKI